MKKISTILTAIKRYYGDSKNRLKFIFLSLILFSLYIYAIEATVGIRAFWQVNTELYISTQIVFMIVNSLLAAFSILITLQVVLDTANFKEASILGTLLSLILSIGTSGCLVCGTVLIPLLGISGSFATLPFAGIEIKIITLLMLFITLSTISEKYLGICPTNKTYTIRSPFGRHQVTSHQLRDFRYFAAIILLTISLFVLPSIFSNTSTIDNVEAGCVYEK